MGHSRTTILLAVVGLFAGCQTNARPDEAVTTRTEKLASEGLPLETARQILSDGSTITAVTPAPVLRTWGTGGYYLAPKAPTSPSSAEPSEKAHLLAEAASGSKDDHVQTTLILQDVPATWSAYRAMT